MEILQKNSWGGGFHRWKFYRRGGISIDGNLTGGPIEIFTGGVIHREFHRWKC